MISYRLAAVADIQSAAAVHIESCLDIYRAVAAEAVESGRLETSLKAIWAEERLTGGDFIVLAEEDGKVIGLSTVRPAKYETPYIDHFHIRPTLKRGGIGRGLIAATFAELRRRGLLAVWLDVAVGNDAALAFYRAMGGVPGETVTGDLFGTPVPAIVVRWDDLPNRGR